MRAKAEPGERSPYGSLAPGAAGSTLSIFGRWGIARKRGGGSGAGARRDLAATWRVAEGESEVELALLVGVGRRRTVPFVGESPGVERREDDRSWDTRTRNWICGASWWTWRASCSIRWDKVYKRGIWIGIPPETGWSSLGESETPRRGAGGAWAMHDGADGVRGVRTRKSELS